MLAAALILSAAPVPPAPPAARREPEIVVTGYRSGRCQLKLADRALSERQFTALAGEWAQLGLAVRVVHPAGTHYRCLARIAFRLNRRGVRLIHFVEQPGAPK